MTDPTTAELVAYLRTRPADYKGMAAADRLEKLEAECERLRKTALGACDSADIAIRIGQKAEADIQKLRDWFGTKSVDEALGE